MRRPPDSPCARPRPRGSALIVALWVVGLLSLLVSSFAFDMHLEARVTSYSRKRLKARYLAQGGFEKAKMLLLKTPEIEKDEEESEFQDEPWYTPAKRLAEGLAVVGLTTPLGQGEVTIDIVPEPARLNINRLGKSDNEIMDAWERILTVGKVPEELWPELIDGFLDWTDKDDEPRFDGGETEDYYSTLDIPYSAKNGPLDTVEEVLLVKGFTPQILFGGLPPDAEEDMELMSGIADLLTVFGEGKVNVNAAPIRILMTLPGVDEVMAAEIIAEREGLTATGEIEEDSYFKNPGDFFGRFPELVEFQAQLEPLLSTMSRIYRITSVGQVQGVKRGIWCIVSFDANAGNITVRRWWEQEIR